MDGPIAGRLSNRTSLILIVFGASLFLIHLGPGWALTYHEAFFAVPAREMLMTGDWVVPRVVGVPAWQKPPFMHWLIAASIRALGTQSEWAVRLPSLAATILNAWLIAWLTARFYGDRIARLAGLIQLTSFYVLFQGRLAECDMPLCATVTGAMFCLAKGTIDREQSPRWLRWLFFTLAGVASLIKGPFALALIGGTSGAFALWERRRCVWRFLLDPIGWILMILIAIGWPIAAYQADPTILDALRVHNLDRFSGAYEGAKDPFFYLYTIPLILLPWTPVAFGGLWSIMRDPSRPRSFWRLMLCWMIIGMAIIQASAWKHKHYAIPFLPPLSIAAACGLDRYLNKARRSGISAPMLAAIVLMISATVCLIVFGVQGQSLHAAVSGMVLVAGSGLLCTVGLRRSGRRDAAVAALFGSVWLVMILTQSFILPRFDLYREPALLASRANVRFADGRPIDQVGVPNPQISYYLRWPLRRSDDVDAFARVIAETPARTEFAVITPEAMLPELSRIGEIEILDRADSKFDLHLISFRPNRSMARADPKGAEKLSGKSSR